MRILDVVEKKSPNVCWGLGGEWNPNFLNLHRIYFCGVEAFDVYSKPNNGTHLKNEVSVKVSNALLYSEKYFSIISEMLEAFGLDYTKLSRLDIALDGSSILKLIDILNRYSRSHTIQTNNDSITILPTAFKKKELRWLGWSIGKSKSGISARVYNKSDEIMLQKKDYISSYWRKNGLYEDKVGRFEIQLNSKRLSKYNIDLNGMKKLSEAEFIGAILKNEVQSWVKFYRVKRKDFLNHKKEVAIKNGKEIQFIHWDKLPTKMELLTIENYTSNSSVICARNTISFNLREILKHPSTSTTSQVEIINKYAVDYYLQDYVKNKIRFLFGSVIKNPYKDILNGIDFQ